MFKLDLVEELNQVRERKIMTPEERAVHQANEILATSSEREIKMLKNLGLLQGENRKLDGSRIYMLSQIEEICVKYGLRFLPIGRYKGNYDATLGPKLVKFEQDYCTFVNIKGTSTENFVIAAPAASFTLEERPVDPLLFYNLGNGEYYLIHKWGNDLSWWRKITQWPMRKAFNFFLTTCVSFVLLFRLIWYAWSFVSKSGPEYYVEGGLLLLMTIILSLAALDRDFRGQFNNKTWNDYRM